MSRIAETGDVFLSKVVEICVEEVTIGHLTDLLFGVHVIAREELTL